MSACLDDDVLVEVVIGVLSAERAAAVDEHVDSCVSCRELLLSVVRSVGERPKTPAPGDRIGRYVIDGELGRGGFGIVVRAQDEELDRPVALKILHIEHTDPEAAERLRNEARSMARLSHPNVVVVYEVVAAPSLGPGVVCVAMELVDGPTLRTWMAAKDRHWLDVLNVFIDAGEGLAAAHEAGLLHRDFKPDNVLVGADGRARVTDFGLARSDAATESNERDLTDSLSAVVRPVTTQAGTPAYMSPERRAGRPSDARGDQFAFAKSLFEALCGVRPADASQPWGEGPRARSVPEPIRRVVRRGFADEPAERFGDLNEMLSALRSARDRATQSPRRWWGALAAVAAAVAVIGVLARPDQDVNPAAASGCVGQGERELADVYNDDVAQQTKEAFMATPFGESSWELVAVRLEDWREHWVSIYDDTCLATHVRNEQTTDRLDVQRGCLQRHRQEVSALLDAWSRDGASIEDATNAAIQLPDPNTCRWAVDELPLDEQTARDVERIEAERAEVAALFDTGRVAEATALIDALVLDADKTKHDPLIARVRALAAPIARASGALTEAKAHATASLWAARRTGDVEHEALGWLLIASIDTFRGAHEEAEAAGKHAREVVETAQAKGSYDAATLDQVSWRIESTLGVVYTQWGRFEQAQEQLQRALSHRESAYGSEAPEVAAVLTNLGNLARAAGRLDEAKRHHERARSIDEKLLGVDHPRSAQHRHNLARIALLQGELDTSQKLYDEALAIKWSVYGKQHPEVGLTLNSLGLLFEQRGDNQRALDHFERAAEMLKPRRYERTLALLNLHRAELAMGDRVEAETSLKQARAEARELDHADLMKQVDDAFDALSMPTAESSAPPTQEPTQAPTAPSANPTPVKPPPVKPPPEAGSYGPGSSWK